MLEKTVEKYLCDEVKKNGGVTRKIRYIGRRGCPDRIVFLEGVYFVETKRPSGGIYSVHQICEQVLYKENKCKIYLIHTKHEVDLFINEILSKSLPKNSH